MTEGAQVVRVLLLAIVLMGVGCKSQQYPKNEPVPQNPTAAAPEERPRELPRAPEATRNPRQAESGIATPQESLPRDTTRDQAAELVVYYRLDDVQMAVISREAIDRYGLGDELAQRLREAFSEMGMRVQNAPDESAGTTTTRTVQEIAARQDADLVTVVLGSARQRARLGNFLSYEAEVRATIYEAGGQMVATKEVTRTGARSTDADKAAESAILSAADELGPFLVEQVIRKTAQNVVTRRVTVDGLRTHQSVMQLVAHLRRRPGINDVRLLSWDATSCVARLLVYMQPAARDNLGAYLVATPDLDVRILSEDQRGLEGRERRISR